jgi:hypothetical protein
MARSSNKRFPWLGQWSVELGMAALALLIGVALMPVLIFYTGALSLGRYEGASLGRLYESVFHGFSDGSLASWIVVFGPYGLYLLFKALRAWWRASARLAS